MCYLVIKSGNRNHMFPMIKKKIIVCWTPAKSRSENSFKEIAKKVDTC